MTKKRFLTEEQKYKVQRWIDDNRPYAKGVTAQNLAIKLSSEFGFEVPRSFADRTRRVLGIRKQEVVKRERATQVQCLAYALRSLYRKVGEEPPPCVLKIMGQAEGATSENQIRLPGM